VQNWGWKGRKQGANLKLLKGYLVKHGIARLLLALSEEVKGTEGVQVHHLSRHQQEKRGEAMHSG
jgi:hypothetical protein